MPENSTNISFVGVAKWFLVVFSLPCFVKAWQGISLRLTATGYSRSEVTRSQLLTGKEALAYGLENLLMGILLLLAAGALWFFWQRNEE